MKKVYRKEYFISRNYSSQYSASGKAKIDVEIIFKEEGIINLGLRRTTYKNTLLSTLITLVSVLRGLFILPFNSTLYIQYPTKKYYNLMVKVGKLKKCKVITIIHDLRSHRKGKLSIPTEIHSLNRNDIIIAHNDKMKEWLLFNNLKTKVVCLNIFDYLSDIDGASSSKIDSSFEIVFAGVLAQRKNGFIYDLDNLENKTFKLNLYGTGFELEKVCKDSIINYKGFFAPEKLIECLKGHFGLVWDGISLDECAGNFGEYLKVNNPHKTSLYLRAGFPVIIWKEAALADFILKNEVGLVVSSLQEMNLFLHNLSEKDYQKMKENAVKVSKQIGSGYFLMKAIDNTRTLLEI